MTNNQVETSGKKGTKNVVLLAMSTLNHKDGVVTGYKYSEVDSHDTDEYIYYSQLEPISRMIKKNQGGLDYVVILATAETQKPIEVKDIEKYENEIKATNADTGIPNDGCNGLSAVEYYTKRLGLSEDQRVIINIDGDEKSKEYGKNLGKSIYDAIEAIKSYQDCNQDYDIKLWLDTQGGGRNINLVINAIVSSIDNPESTMDVTVAGTYSVAFNRFQELQPIINQTSTYRVFDFVSGINELRAYGRADQLYAYYQKQKKDLGISMPRIIDVMRELTNSIQVCDVNRLENFLNQLRNQFVKKTDENGIEKLHYESNDAILNIFSEQIIEDYGKLLLDNCSKIDIVEWLWKKKFYQQTLTYIESRMPKHWIERGMWRCAEESEITKKPQGKAKDLKEKKENYLLNAVLFKTFGPSNSIEDTRINDISTRSEHYYKRKKEHIICYEEKSEKKNVDKEQHQYKCVICAENANLFFNILELYGRLKKERNNVNHMGDKIASVQKLDVAIETFIVWNRELESEAQS